MKRFKTPIIEIIFTGIIIGLAIVFNLLKLVEGMEIFILLALVFVTAAYAKSAEKQAGANVEMVEEMKRTREILNRPSIIAYFDNPRSTLIDLVIKNTGYGAAKDVSLKIEPPFYDHNERNIAGLSLFKKGINYFPPNREFRQIVGTSTQFFREGSQRPLEYNLTVSYTDVDDNSLPAQVIPLDLSVYRDLPIHRESDIDKLAKEISNLAAKIRH